MRWLAVVLCAAWCALAAGCGSIGEPLYPALHIPSRVTDLTAIERGDRIDVNFTIPPLTTEGLALKDIGGVELRAGTNPANGWNLQQWMANSTRADVPAPEQPGPVHAQFAAGPFVGKQIVVGVRVANDKGRNSEWSDFKVVNVEQPLAQPADLKATAVPEGVQLSWSAPGASQFRVYRKAGQEAKAALLATVTSSSYVDASTEYGKTYEYSVQGLRGQTESDVSASQSITPKDIFPPHVPTGLTVSAGVGAIELAWDRNTEADFKEYRVYRAEGEGPFSMVAQGLEAPAYSDRKIESGKRYRYQVSAVDQSGNASMPSNPVEVSAP